MKNFLIALIVVVVAAGAYYLWQGNAVVPQGDEAMAPESGMPVPGTNTPEVIVEGDDPVDVSAPMTATITYDSNGFSPSSVTIKNGGRVTWKNASGGSMWVASAQHPSHIAYSGTSREEHCPDTSGTAFDQCEGGGDYSFTFGKTGTWNYHDHLKAQFFGKVIVVE